MEVVHEYRERRVFFRPKGSRVEMRCRTAIGTGRADVTYSMLWDGKEVMGGTAYRDEPTDDEIMAEWRRMLAAFQSQVASVPTD